MTVFNVHQYALDSSVSNRICCKFYVKYISRHQLKKYFDIIRTKFRFNCVTKLSQIKLCVTGRHSEQTLLRDLKLLHTYLYHKFATRLYISS